METGTLGGAATPSLETGRKSRSWKPMQETEVALVDTIGPQIAVQRASCIGGQRCTLEKNSGDASSPAGASSLGNSWPCSWDSAPESQRDKLERIAMRRKRAEAKLLQERGKWSRQCRKSPAVLNPPKISAAFQSIHVNWDSKPLGFRVMYKNTHCLDCMFSR